MFLIQTESEPSLAALALKLSSNAAVPSSLKGTGEARDELHASVGAGFCVQLSCLARREKNTLFRDKTALIAMVMAPLLLNLLFALIFFKAGDRSSSTYDITTHFGSITQIAIGGMFGAAQPLLLKFPLEAALFKREFSSGAYSATAYFLSKTVVELPKAFIVSSLTWLASYYIIGLEGNLLFYIVSLWLMGLASSSTALLVGCLSSNVEVALQSAPAIFVPQILFAGIFIKSSQIPAALRLIQYICSLRYGINLLLITEFSSPTTNDWNLTDASAAHGLLEREGITPSSWWVNVVVLIAITVGFRLMGLAALSRRASSV